MPQVPPHFHFGFKPDVEFEVDQECLSDDSDESSDDRFDEEIKIDNMKYRSHMLFNELLHLMPFDGLQELLTPVIEDGCVRKQIIKPGIGVVVPENSYVIIHYDAFLEGQKLPFDSTRLRNRPRKFSLSDRNILPFLDVAIQTMKKGEISKCLVSFLYAYGERRNQNARILYILELVAFFESKDALDFEEMSPEEQEKASFEKLIAVFHCEHQVSNNIFRNKNFELAIARYRKMVRLLENVSVANEEEGKLRNGYLVKLYSNLCLAFTNIRNSETAILYGHSAITLDDNNPKAMYRLGCAYLMADQFRKAKHYLLQAKKNQSFVSRVEKVLLELQQKEFGKCILQKNIYQ